MSFEVLDDEVSGATSAVYIGRNGVVCYDIKEPEPFDVTWGLVAFPPSALEHVGFHHLAVVPA